MSRCRSGGGSGTLVGNRPIRRDAPVEAASWLPGGAVPDAFSEKAPVRQGRCQAHAADEGVAAERPSTQHFADGVEIFDRIPIAGRNPKVVGHCNPGETDHTFTSGESKDQAVADEIKAFLSA
jgi:hypothetical protein